MTLSRCSVLVVLAVALAAGCSSTAIEFTDEWSRPAPPNSEVLAVYVTLEGSDVLEEIASDDCVAVELHETTMVDDVMEMRPLGLPYRIDGTLEMGPGATHLMCIDPASVPVTGDSIQVTFVFESAGTVIREVPVEDRTG